MDASAWKQVLREWLKATELTDDCSIEQGQLEDFFYKFHYKLFGDACNKLDKIRISDFLEENFSEYEILYNETGRISLQDYIYIYSMLLYYACVVQENEFFQNCCTILIENHQMGIFGFLEYCTVNPHFSKASLRTAIKEAVLVMSPPTSPQKSPRVFTITSSPLTTPTKAEKEQQTNSSSTPNKEIFNQQMKEIKILKTQLDNERFEKTLMEAEIRQHQDKIDQLVQKCHMLNHEAQKLKCELLAESQNENRSPNTSQSEKHIRNKLQKEIQKRDELISDLKCENNSISATNQRYKEKVATMEKQMKDMYNKILDLDASLNDLHYSVVMKDEKIHMLEKENREFSDHLSFINETRSMGRDSSSCSDLLEFSCSTYHTINNSDHSESLGRSVIDLQLKEKDTEIKELREMLSLAFGERNSLEQKVSSLIKTIKTLEVKLNGGETNSTVLENGKPKESESNQLQLSTSKQMLEKNKNNDDTVVSVVSDVDDEVDWLEDDDEDKKSVCSKRLGNGARRDKSWQRENYLQHQKQMRNKTFNDARRRRSSLKSQNADTTTTSQLTREDEEGDY